MKTTVWHVCQDPRRKDCDIDILVDVDLPFIPIAGMLIAPTPQADYLTVDDVFWHAARPDHLVVFVEAEGPRRTFSYWKDQGFRRPTKDDMRVPF